MNALTHFFTMPWAERLGWTLVHFLWQGTALAVLFAAVCRLAAQAARARHAMACATLVTMVAAPAVTWFMIGGPAVHTVGATVARTDGAPLVAAGGALGSAPMETLLPWLAMAWVAGAIGFSLRLAGGWLSTARLRSGGARRAPEEWERTLHRLTRKMEIGVPVRLVVSSRVDVPAVLGWLRPVVLVPMGALTGLPAEHVEALLIHELAHIRRNDYLINLLQGVAEALLFYHPAVWWVSRQIRIERELCCDDVAVEASGDVLTYARALAELERCRPSRAAMAMAADGHSLAARIRRLIEPATPSHTMPGAGAAWVLALALLAGLGTAAVVAAQSAPQQSPGGYPAVDRNDIWVDTVRVGDLSRAVRGLGLLASPSAVELKIAETQSREIRAGQRVSIEFQGINGVTVGRVAQVRPGVLNGTVTVDVRVEAGLPGAAAAGHKVDGTIEIAVIPSVLIVGRPVSARENADDTLFRLEPGGNAAVRVQVHYGRGSVNTIEIASGLQPGDKVILNDMPAFKGAERVDLK
jgi:beta-lactamase regulating signal transducer with metallopeptidase domain